MFKRLGYSWQQQQRKEKKRSLNRGGIRSHDHAPVSSVAGGDDTRRPRRQEGSFLKLA
jgi:hypothetical protein